ncbi:MAG: polyprenyl diphosphate synthase [Pseudomonadota bacterium]
MTYDITPSGNLHVGIIMDGNGRWATQRGHPRLKGHSQGAETVKEIVEAAPNLGITHLTLFAFSTENWKRSEREVSGLMALFRRYITSQAERLITENVRVRFIGGQNHMEPRVLELMGWLEKETRDNGGLNLTVAINYGGRDEVARAVQKIVAKCQTGELSSAAITEKTISNHLDTAELPDPDLLIRTGGEMRLSNFLAWQNVYAELSFDDRLWPDFTRKDLAAALERFRGRDRRFGAVAAE